MKILLADDHVLFREGARLVLEEYTEGEIRVVEVGTFAEALACIRQDPDFQLMLIDLTMPGMDGLTGLQLLRRVRPAVPIVVLTASEDPRHVRRALEFGARGYVSKASGTSVMMEAIAATLAGDTFVGPGLSPATQGEAVDEDGGGPAQLTPRQLDVLAMLRKGKSNKEIARDLRLAEITVKLHVTAIFRALGVHNRTQAALAAEQMGL